MARLRRGQDRAPASGREHLRDGDVRDRRIDCGLRRALPRARPRRRARSRRRRDLLAVGPGRDHSRGGFEGSRRSRRYRTDAGGGHGPESEPFRADCISSSRLHSGPAHAHSGIVLPRTSDPDYKCFLYLRELVRRGVVSALPPVLLFDLLQSGGAEVPRYDAARTSELLARLAHISQRHPADDDLRAAIGAANTARAAARRLDGLRRATEVGGLEGFPLLGAFWQLAPERYAGLADAAADAISAVPRSQGRARCCAGVPVDSNALHAADRVARRDRRHGAESFRRSCRGRRVDTAPEPISAIADRYRKRSIDARTPVDGARATDRKSPARRRCRRDLAAARRCELRLGFSEAAPAARAALRVPCGARRRSVPADRRVGSSSPRSARRRFGTAGRAPWLRSSSSRRRGRRRSRRRWFAELRRRVFDERQPYALVQADVPFELFDLLDIPAVSNQWWAALVAAKRQAPAYLDAMRADGVPDSSAATAASGSRRHATAERRKRRGAGCRRRACSARA